MRKKKLLSMEDLLWFFKKNNLTKFSSADSGYKLCVQIPTTFEVDENVDDAHRGMMRLKIRVFHLDLNRNGSFVSEKAAKDAMPTIKNRPIMAYIHQLDNGEWDFESHNMVIETDSDGNEFYEYQEKQVGSFDEGDPFFEYDEELDKTYVCAYAYISEEYTRACDIIRRKGGTKNSCELSIEELGYNANDGYLDLQKFYVSASTLLGSRDDGTEVGEGMLGSRADIADFSELNNSILSNKEEFINQIADVVVERLGNIDKNQRKEEPVEMDFEEKIDEVTEEINVTNEEATEEETPVIKEEASEGVDEQITETPDEVVEEFDEIEESEKDTEEVTPDNTFSNKKKYSVNGVEFELSLSDIQNAMCDLVNSTYSESDNDYYGCEIYQDSKTVVMIGMWSGKAYKQNYKVRGGVYNLVGDRIPVKPIFVTSDEEAELDKMRANYSSISQKLEKYEAEPTKMEILNSEDYTNIADTAEFVELKKEENHFDMSVEELKAEADRQLLEYAKGNKIEFSEEKKSVGMKQFSQKKSGKAGRYGSLFNK